MAKKFQALEWSSSCASVVTSPEGQALRARE
jgi:hypothetical protein